MLNYFWDLNLTLYLVLYTFLQIPGIVLQKVTVYSSIEAHIWELLKFLITFVKSKDSLI